jgi:hypothetical protein
MNIYLAERTDDNDYDEYDALCFVAPDENSVRLMIAEGPIYTNMKGITSPTGDFYSGFTPTNYTIKLIGIAFDEIPVGKLIGSFNAG